MNEKKEEKKRGNKERIKWLNVSKEDGQGVKNKKNQYQERKTRGKRSGRKDRKKKKWCR